jgi:hypothetical protein
VFTSAQVAPSLGRPLASASTVTVNILKPGTLYAERTRQLDLRFTKTVKVGRTRLQGMIDLRDDLRRMSAAKGAELNIGFYPRRRMALRVVPVGVMAGCRERLCAGIGDRCEIALGGSLLRVRRPSC